MYVASQNGHYEVVDMLVKAGADVNQACTTVSKINTLIGKVLLSRNIMSVNNYDT